MVTVSPGGVEPVMADAFQQKVGLEIVNVASED